MLTESCKKVAEKYWCLSCDYNTSRKSSYDKHLMTSKHSELTKVNHLLTKSCKKVAEDEIFVCNKCNKEYKSRVGLWKHKSKCDCQNISQDNNITTDKDLIMMLIKENSEFKTMMMKVLENGTTHNTTTHTNSHNKAFNLNFFLNETCKDAMNIMDFVESIKLQVTDLERIGEVGYVEGISDIIVSNLNKLDITQRPIHCTDKKRETIYIKDAGKWEKDETTNLIRKAIRKVTHNNQRLLPQFKEKYPDYHNSYSSHSDKVTKVIIETMVNNVPEKEEKIIKNIAKSVVLNRGT